MRIKFSKKDPRNGMIVEMEGDRAQELIDRGAAERVSDNTATAPAKPDAETAAVAEAVSKKSVRKGK